MTRETAAPLGNTIGDDLWARVELADQKNADIVEQSLLSNPDLTLILVSHHLSPERKAQFTKVYEMKPVS